MTGNTEWVLRVEKILEDRSRRAKELKAEGKKIIGQVCIYAPVEVISALDMVPFRISGSINERADEADRLVPRTLCPFIRNVLSLSLGGRYDFLDGVVMVHTCDAMERSSRAWETVATYPYIHFMDMPTKTGKRHQEALRDSIDDLRNTLESFSGEKLQTHKLKEAIERHNEQRHLVKELYEFTKLAPPLISGTEIAKIIGAVTCLPVKEGNALLEQVIEGIKERNRSVAKGSARILVWGSVLDNPALVEMIEDAGANVVIDDICTGTRGYFGDVTVDHDLLSALAHHYLVDLKCPRTFRAAPGREGKKDYLADLEDRFGYLKEFANMWNVDGVILQSVKYCDCHGFEVPQVKDYFGVLKIPCMYLEHDYTRGGVEFLRMRVEAFLEMIVSDFL